MTQYIYMYPCQPHTQAFPCFQCTREKSGRPGRSGDVMGCHLRCSCVSLSTHPHSYSLGEAMTMFIVWVSGWRYATAPQTASDYITRSTGPSQYFSHMLKTWESLGTRVYPCHIKPNVIKCIPPLITKLHYFLYSPS